eukprot:scaffold8237_cov27-Tisochrysis_lutea.AAC.1
MPAPADPAAAAALASSSATSGALACSAARACLPRFPSLVLRAQSRPRLVENARGNTRQAVTHAASRGPCHHPRLQRTLKDAASWVLAGHSQRGMGTGAHPRHRRR